MRTADLLRTAVRNTFRSKLRTTLTVLALVVGSTTLTLTTALGAGVTDYVTRQVDALGAEDVLVVTATSPDTNEGPAPYDPERSVGSAAAGGPLPGAGTSALTDASLEDLRAVPGLSQVEPIRTVTVDYVRSERGSDRYELTIAPTSSIASADLAAGEQLDTLGDEPQVVLPEDYVEPLALGSVSTAVGRMVVMGVTDVFGEQHEVTARVVGVSNPSLLSSGAGGNPALVEELAAVQAADVDRPAQYAVATARFDPATSDEDLQEIKDEVAAAGMTAQTVSDQLGLITTVITGITGVLSAFAVVALFAAAFGIVNTLLMSVQERTREIGLMKAMGMRDRRVFALFSLEAALIGVLGSALGVVLAVGIGAPLSSALSAGPLSALGGLDILLFEPSAMLGVMALIVTIAFLAGTLPARAAARKTPIDALRYE